jgi:hypothetical protein
MMKRLYLAGLAKTLCLGGLSAAFAFACSTAPPGPSSGSAGPSVQDRGLVVGPPAVAGVDGPVGVTEIDTPVQPWAGAPPLVRTTADIMAEAARTPAAQLDLRRPRFRKARPDRRGLPQNPDALPDTIAPPALDRGDGASVAQTAAAPTVDVARLADTASLPPDTMGDVGPTQYLVAINGRIRSLDKLTGVADGDDGIDASFDVFFSGVRGGAGTTDPRVRYDRRTQRWFVVMITVAVPNRYLVAVSSTASIGAATSWAFHQWTNTRTQDGVGGAASCLGDYPTLGLDEDALYIGANQFCGASLASALTFDSTSVYVLNKSALVGGALSVAQFDGVLPSGSSPGIYTPQGVDNLDANTSTGYVIGVDNSGFGTLVMRRVTNPASAPSLSGDIFIDVAPTGVPIDVPHPGGTLPLHGLDDRLLQAVIRNGRLWTAQQIEVDVSGAYSPAGERNGVRWYELQNLASTPAVAQSGTVFDAAAANPASYWMGALMPNGQGHVALGMSRAGATSRVNTAFTGRLATDPANVMDPPVIYSNNSSFAYNVQTDPDTYQRWGDYSYTSVDPDDDQTLWTLQEYVDAPNSYAVRLTRLLAPPPAAITTLTPSVLVAGRTGVAVAVTGSATGGRGFFDPGSGFLRRIGAAFSGTGVTVTGVVVNSPTSLTLTVSTVGAAMGARTLTVTNPDGQTASRAAALTVGDGANLPPVFGTVPGDRTIFDAGAGASTGPIAFTVSDPEGGAVAVTATSSNVAVIPTGSITLGGTLLNRIVTVSSVGTLGSSTITLTASDGALTATTTFEVTVSASALPGAPQNLTAVVVRNFVVFSWQAPATAASEPVSGYTLEAGFGAGQTVGTLALGDVLTHTVNAPTGVFFVRLRAQTAAGFSPPSNEIQVATGEAGPPLAPQALLATVQGTAVSLQWSENPVGPVIAGYHLQAGTAAGLSDVGVLPLPATARTFNVDAVPGTYFVRVVAVNAAGVSVASNEAVLTPGSATCTIPAAPLGLLAGSSTGMLSVQWNPAESGAIPVTYVLQAGSVSGAADIGAVGVAGTTTAAAGAVPAGPYFLRVFAVNACGTSPASEEASTVVP